MTSAPHSPSAAAPASSGLDAWVGGPRAWLLLLLLGLMVYIPFLGMRDMWYPDEPDIAEVTKVMFESGDWVAPRRVGVIWVDYPPMIYWTGATASHLLGGFSEFALRLPNALASIALVLLVYFVGARWYDRRTAFWAAFALMTFVEFTNEAISYRPDVNFSLAIAAAMFLWVEGTEGRGRWGPRVAAFALFGVAMLAKGPLGLLLPGLVLTLWHASRREWRRILEMAPLSAVALAVYLPWFVACARAMGADSILYELYAQNFARFVGGARGHEQPLHYYLAYIWADLFPWSLVLPVALVWIVRARRWRDRKVQLWLWWFGTFFVFLSMAVTKRQLYLLPAYPAVAMLLAPWLAALGRERPEPDPRPARFFAAGLAAFWLLAGLVLFGVVVWIEPLLARLDLDAVEVGVAHALRPRLVPFAALLLAAGLWIGRAWRRRDTPAALLRVGLTQLALYAALAGLLLPAFNPTKTYKPQGQWIRAQIGDETHIGLVHPQQNYAYRKMGAFALYADVLVERMETREAIERFLREHPRSVVLVEEEISAEIFAGHEPELRRRTLRNLQTASYHYLVIR